MQSEYQIGMADLSIVTAVVLRNLQIQVTDGPVSIYEARIEFERWSNSAHVIVGKRELGI